jgi:hypothetical protein
MFRENRVYLECTTKGKCSFIVPATYHYTMEYENDAAVDILHSMMELINHAMRGEPVTLEEACGNFNEFVDGVKEALLGDEDEHELRLRELKEAVAKLVSDTKAPKTEDDVSDLESENLDEERQPDIAALMEMVQAQGEKIATLSTALATLGGDLREAKSIQRSEIRNSGRKLEVLEGKLMQVRADAPQPDWCHNIETQLYNLELGDGGATRGVDTTSDLLKADVNKLSYEITLLKERSGEAIEVGEIKIRSVAESFLFVNDHVDTCSFSCFHDFMCLLDSIRSTDIDSTEYVRSEHDAMKAKLLDVQEVYISASFGHLAPLPFCRKTGTQEISAQGSLGRALPLVKNRDMWYSMGGTIGLKKTMTKDLAGKVASLKAHIRFSLGDSLGAELALSYLESSHTCWKEFVSWTEDFYAELTGTSEVEPKEAWELILQCWLGFFNDLRDVRRDCSSISATGLEVGSNARKEVVGRYIWTMGKAIQVQDEYLAKDFRNHPTISGVINYHLFLHRTPSTAFRKLAKKHEETLHSLNDFKGKAERRLKKLEDRS